MRKKISKTTWILIASLPLLTSKVLAVQPGALDQPNLIIASEGRCVDSAGIAIKEVPDNQVKVACLRDRSVQDQCNPDGGHARIQAFRQWETQLMDFKDRCTAVGGVFAYATPGFQEPTDDTFCTQAQPVVQYSEFETPLCNFVSRCPQVAVTCVRTEDAILVAQRMVSLPGIPKPVSVSY